jgi:hypothetical protein
VAALHFEFVVDSDVYPELHAALASIGSHESRRERMRQLAATGLLWEAVRIHGASIAGISGPSNPAYPELALAAAKGSVRTRTRNAARPDRRAPTPPSPGDSLDPAIVPAMPHIPVLLDVVHPASPSRPHSSPAAPRQRALSAATAVRPFVQAAPALPLQSEVPAFACNEDASPDEQIDRVDVLAPVATLMHKPVTRSRLLRMKEKGLFKNG